MSNEESGLRGFKTVFTVIGVVYVLLASSWLVQGTTVLLDFGVPETMASAPLVEDFFSFFYQLMAWVGILMILFGQVTRGRRDQRRVAATFCVGNVLTALRDLSTSDSPFGNHLYDGPETLIFVAISLVFAVAFGALALSGGFKKRSG